YAEHGVPGTFLMPGASEALRAVHDVGGSNIVVTAKYQPNAIACLAHVGVEVDAVIGWRHGPTKGITLFEHGAAIYVGDTPSDAAGAPAADAVALAVASGPHDPASLRAAGADAVLGSLSEFAGWLTSWRGGG